MLFEDASILSLDNIKQLFVSYMFLDYDPEQLETPFSLPKPKPNQPISFNFKKGNVSFIYLLIIKNGT